MRGKIPKKGVPELRTNIWHHSSNLALFTRLYFKLASSLFCVCANNDQYSVFISICSWNSGFFCSARIDFEVATEIGEQTRQHKSRNKNDNATSPRFYHIKLHSFLLTNLFQRGGQAEWLRINFYHSCSDVCTILIILLRNPGWTTTTFSVYKNKLDAIYNFFSFFYVHRLIRAIRSFRL